MMIDKNIDIPENIKNEMYEKIIDELIKSNADDKINLLALLSLVVCYLKKVEFSEEELQIQRNTVKMIFDDYGLKNMDDISAEMKNIIDLKRNYTLKNMKTDGVIH